MSSDPALAIALVRDFVNTAEPQLGLDQLAAATASACLEGLHLAEASDRFTEADLSLLTGVREGLRQLLLEHTRDANASGSDTSAFNDLLRSVPMTVQFAAGTPILHAVGETATQRVIASIVTAVITAPPDEWTRLKVCSRDSCRWAFFDASRNRSGRWCSMAGCGNIVKMRRAYRTRAGR